MVMVDLVCGEKKYFVGFLRPPSKIRLNLELKSAAF